MPFGRTGFQRNVHGVAEFGEAEHLDLYRPSAIFEVREAVSALLVRRSGDFLLVFGRRDRGAGNRQSGRSNDTAILCRPQSRGCKTEQRQKTATASKTENHTQDHYLKDRTVAAPRYENCCKRG